MERERGGGGREGVVVVIERLKTVSEITVEKCLPQDLLLFVY